MTNWSPGLRNQVVLDDMVLPVLPGSTFSMPRNLDIPQVFSGDNLYQWVWIEGLQFPVINMQTMIHSGWWLKNKIAAWFTRADDDVASAGTLKYWNGVTGFSCSACKVNILSIGGSLGQRCRCQIAVVGMGDFDVLIAKPASSPITGPAAGFQHTVLGGGFDSSPGVTNAIASFDLTLSNNLDVCPEINDELFSGSPLIVTSLPEQNSGQQTGTLRVVAQAKATRPADSAECTVNITPPSGASALFTIKNPICHDPREMALQFPRQMKEYNYALLGGTGPGDPPVSIT